MISNFLNTQCNELTQTLQNTLTEFTKNLNTQGIIDPSSPLGSLREQSPSGSN